MKRILILAVVLSALLAPTAQASIVRSELDAPYSGACIGRADFTAVGRATWQPVPSTAQLESFEWALQARPAGGPTWSTVKTGSNQVPSGGSITSFAPLNQPNPLDMQLVVTADDTAGPPQQVASSVRTGVRVDGTTPPPPSNFQVRAVSANQAGFTWTNGGGGYGCAGNTLWTSLRSGSTDYPGIFQPGGFSSTLVYNLSGGNSFTARDYHFVARASNSVGNQSVESQSVTFRTRADNKTVLNGTVTGQPQNGPCPCPAPPLFGVFVYVDNAQGQVVGSTMTDANGWYNVPLTAGTYTVRFEQAGSWCSICAKGYQNQTYPNITATQQGDILTRSVTLPRQ